ncbi:hypothetical protein [Paenarthrobacter sp. NPDC090522]|uniref:hypothetical protein n=1 Tax=Paenarthrobacter sp. NPDC090522 TaxID=3364383 RepID=UPI0037F1F5F3
MGTGIALWKGDSWDFGWGTLTLDSHNGLTLKAGEGEVRMDLSLDSSAFVDAYATDECVWAVGGADPQVVLASRIGPHIRTVLRAERLATSPGVELGGHAVRFHPLSAGDRCLLTWEYGVALLDSHAGCVWSHLHRDPELRLRKLTNEVVELSGIRQVITLVLADGSTTSRAFDRQVGIDRETLTEWQRGIGR